MPIVALACLLTLRALWPTVVWLGPGVPDAPKEIQLVAVHKRQPKPPEQALRSALSRFGRCVALRQLVGAQLGVVSDPTAVAAHSAGSGRWIACWKTTCCPSCCWTARTAAPVPTRSRT